MLKKTIATMAVLTATAGFALGQDASTTPASRIQTPLYTSTNAYGQTVISAQPITGGTQPVAADAPPAAAIVTPPAASTGCSTCGDSPAKCTLHGWFNVDYMMLFPNRTNVPTLLADGNGNALAGNSPDLGISHAVRANTGMWLCDGQIGMQAIAMFSFRSYVNQTAPAGFIPLNFAAVPATNFNYQTWHQIAGGEGNTLYRLVDGETTKVYGLFGTRYLNFEEDLSTTYNIAGSNFLDEFHTRNQFAGLQFGARVVHTMGKLDLDGTAKLALGVNYTQLYILGSNDGFQPIQAFTGRRNIGFYESNYFGMLPEVDLNARYHVTERLSINVGYTFLMSINNWRPGDQVSTNFGAPFGPAVRSTYFLHGLTAGLTFAY